MGKEIIGGGNAPCTITYPTLESTWFRLEMYWGLEDSLMFKLGFYIVSLQHKDREGIVINKHTSHSSNMKALK